MKESIESKFGNIKLKKFKLPFSKKTVYGVTINHHLYVSTAGGIKDLIHVLENGGSITFSLVKEETATGSDSPGESTTTK